LEINRIAKPPFQVDVLHSHALNTPGNHALVSLVEDLHKFGITESGFLILEAWDI